MRISACYIVKNEKEVLQKSLQQIENCVDEIIVVDTGSTDGSQQIAADAGAKVYPFVWEQDFSSARNYALSRAIGDWIIFLDADEYFSKNIDRYLLENILREEINNEVLLIKLYNIENKEENSIIDFFYAPRIFKNDKSLRYEGRIHEQLKKNGELIEKVVQIDSNLLSIYHTGYDKSIAKEKAKRNLELLLQLVDNENAPDKQYVDMYLAETYEALGDKIKAVEHARKDIASGRKQGTYVSRSHRLILRILQEDKAAASIGGAAAAAAITDFPEIPEFRAEYARYLAESFNYDDAIKEIEKAIQLDQSYTGLEPSLFNNDLRNLAKKLLEEWKIINKNKNNIKISACVIAKNEEKEIGAWIENMKQCTDEQILIDTGSTDKTVSIAMAAGIKIYHYQWENDFAAAKNYAIEQANGDWIIFLDADETFSEESLKYIRSLIAREHHRVNETDAIICSIINIDKDKDNMEISRFLNLRIFRNVPYLRYKGKVHECIQHQNEKLRIVCEKELLKIYHTGYSSKRIKAKLLRNLEILEKDIAEKGEGVAHYRYLANCYQGLGDYKKAIKYAKLHIRSDATSIGNESEVYRTLINSMISSGEKSEKIIFYIGMALKKFPHIPDFYAYLAVEYIHKKDFFTAKSYLMKSLNIYFQKVQNTLESSSFASILSEVYAWLAHIYWQEKSIEEAQRYVDLALKDQIYNKRAFYVLYQLIQGRCTADIINVLNVYYRPVKKDIIFVLECLEEVAIDETYFYYVDLLKKNGEPIKMKSQVYKMISNGNVEQSYEQILKILVDRVQWLVYIALAIGDFSEVQAIRVLLPTTFWHCVERYYEQRERMLDNDWDGYSALLPAIIHAGNQNIITRFSVMGKDFSFDKLFEVFRILCQYNSWTVARILMDELLKNEGEKLGTDFFRLAGICFYYTGEYDVSKKYLEQAKNAGDEGADIVAYLQWIDEIYDI